MPFSVGKGITVFQSKYRGLVWGGRVAREMWKIVAVKEGEGREIYEQCENVEGGGDIWTTRSEILTEMWDPWIPDPDSDSDLIFKKWVMGPVSK
ncbi:hypothetical protein M0R45_032827 [Rubus argutus]|uniref:Uncharacterized protein n=1 Tax=Rubus argutus TaxID=59490 RepID=A0AAW1WKE9_RUBAR